jgi:hypothetical protein
MEALLKQLGEVAELAWPVLLIMAVLALSLIPGKKKNK